MTSAKQTANVWLSLKCNGRRRLASCWFIQVVCQKFAFLKFTFHCKVVLRKVTEFHLAMKSIAPHTRRGRPYTEANDGDGDKKRNVKKKFHFLLSSEPSLEFNMHTYIKARLGAIWQWRSTEQCCTWDRHLRKQFQVNFFFETRTKRESEYWVIYERFWILNSNFISNASNILKRQSKAAGDQFYA